MAYNQGLDVHYYDEDNVDDGDGMGIVFNAVSNAIAHRGVTNVAIFGHSHGGGSTYHLAYGLDNNRANIGNFSIEATVYVDAIKSSGTGSKDSEIRLPPGTQYHANYYQRHDPPWPIPTIRGDFVPGATINLNVNETTWGVNLGHGEIDNDPTVQVLVRDFLMYFIKP